MQNYTAHRHKLPFKSRLLSLSLAGATLLLIIIYLLRRMDYLSTEVAIWAAVGVFIAAAIYESFMFSLITRHMMKGLNNTPTNAVQPETFDDEKAIQPAHLSGISGHPPS